MDNNQIVMIIVIAANLQNRKKKITWVTNKFNQVKSGNIDINHACIADILQRYDKHYGNIPFKNHAISFFSVARISSIKYYNTTVICWFVYFFVSFFYRLALSIDKIYLQIVATWLYDNVCQCCCIE